MKKWVVRDRYGNYIYMTEERWHHILESRPELEPFFEQLLETIRAGRRKQDAMIPNEYKYFKEFDSLLPANNHLVVIVVFKTKTENGHNIPNNFVITGWASFFASKG